MSRSNMKTRTMNRNNIKYPRHEAFNYNTIALPLVGFFNETTLSWQFKQYVVCFVHWIWGLFHI